MGCWIVSVIKDIHFIQDDFELKIPHLELDDNGVTALIGPSGSGKTTLIRLLLGLEFVKGWSWILDGEEVSGLPIQKRNFGVVFQTLELFPHMTALENILFPLSCRSYSAQEAKEISHSLMEKLEIIDCSSRRPDQLSGGERQRVALARALSFRPRFLFLDEPFSSLDQEAKENSRKLVQNILQDQKIPALLVSHDQQDIERLSSRVYQLRKGQLL